jgi:hypothetical protein
MALHIKTETIRALYTLPKKRNRSLPRTPRQVVAGQIRQVLHARRSMKGIKYWCSSGTAAGGSLEAGIYQRTSLGACMRHCGASSTRASALLPMRCPAMHDTPSIIPISIVSECCARVNPSQEIWEIVICVCFEILGCMSARWSESTC